MFTLTFHTLIFLCGIAFIAGYIDSIAGGGGMINMPALLLVGLPAHDVLGTNKFSNMFGTINASRIFLKKKILPVQPWLPGMISAFAGGIAGVFLTHSIPNQHLKTYLPWMILLVAIYFLTPFSMKNITEMPIIDKHKKHLSLFVGFGMGLYDGFFGPGTGAFLTMFGVMLFALPMLKSMAMARFFNLSANVSATLIFIALGNVNFKVGICMAIANMCGGQLGAHSAIKFGIKYIRYAFIIIVIGMVTKLIFMN